MLELAWSRVNADNAVAGTLARLAYHSSDEKYKEAMEELTDKD